jgi:ATP-dependent DNA helicase RecG
MPPISATELLQRLQSEEGQYFDRKSLWHGAPGAKRPRDRREVRDEIAAYVAAFANADGGVIVLGVEDDATVTGHGYPEDAVADMLRVPEVRLKPPQPPGERVIIDGKELLVFSVEPAPSAVMVIGDGFPYRVKDEVIQSAESSINAIKRQGLVESAEARPAPLAVSFQALDPELLARASGAKDESNWKAYLVQRRLGDWRGDGLVLRSAAVWLFAGKPETIEHPNAGVRVFRVNGTERKVGSQHNVREFPRIEGNLPSVLDTTRALLSTLIRSSARLHDLFFRETPEYPTFAWQEALVNAVAHRDYALQGRGVEVWLFDDRLEVSSPGGLLPEVHLDELLQRKSVHLSRNPRIARVLADLGVMRDQGEGIPRMIEEMEESLLPLPELVAEAHSFRVVLRNEPIFTSDDPAWVAAVRRMELSLAQKRALVAYVGRDFASRDYQELNQVNRDEAYRELAQLVAAGLLEQFGGPTRATAYRVVKPAAPAGAPPSPRELLVERMAKRGRLTNAVYREVFGVDRATAKRALARLVSLGGLVAQGERRGAHYLPGPAWPAALQEGG